jgi:hypothetical protein
MDIIKIKNTGSVIIMVACALAVIIAVHQLWPNETLSAMDKKFEQPQSEQVSEKPDPKTEYHTITFQLAERYQENFVRHLNAGTLNFGEDAKTKGYNVGFYIEAMQPLVNKSGGKFVNYSLGADEHGNVVTIVYALDKNGKLFPLILERTICCFKPIREYQLAGASRDTLLNADKLIGKK